MTLWALLSNGATFSRVQVWWSSGSTRWDWSRTKVVAGDFNGDGKTDVGLYYDYGGRTAKMWVLALDRDRLRLAEGVVVERHRGRGEQPRQARRG